MQFRCLLEFSLVLLNTGHLSRVSPNAEQYVPAILGNTTGISFIECTSTIKKEGSIFIRLETIIRHNDTDIQTCLATYYLNIPSFDVLVDKTFMTVCYKEENEKKAAIKTRTYLINTPKVFQYTCDGSLLFLTRELKELTSKNNITDGERFASSSIRCQGHDWCNNQPGSENYSSNKRCCNSALCHASRSGRWHDPVCCFYIARKQMPSDFTTRMVVTNQTYFLALSLLVVFTVCSVILGILQMKSMDQEKQLKMREARKRRGKLDDLKAVQKLRSCLKKNK